MNVSESEAGRCIVTLHGISQELQQGLERYCESHRCRRVVVRSEADLDEMGKQGLAMVVFCQHPAEPKSAEGRIVDCSNKPFARICVGDSTTVSHAVSAMQHGYFTVLEAVPTAEELEKILAAAFAAATQRLHDMKRKQRMNEILDSMTEGERLVLRSVVDGHLNKRIAKRLEISERTVEARRKRIFEKTATTSVAMLVRVIVESIGIEELYKRCQEKPLHPPAPHLHLSGEPSSTEPTTLQQHREA